MSQIRSKKNDVDLSYALMSCVYRYIFVRRLWYYLSEETTYIDDAYEFIIKWQGERNVRSLFAARVVSFKNCGIVLVSEGFLRANLSYLIPTTTGGIYCLCDIPHCLKKAKHVPKESYVFYDRNEATATQIKKIKELCEINNWISVDTASLYFAEIIYNLLHGRCIESNILSNHKNPVRKVRKVNDSYKLYLIKRSRMMRTGWK